MCRSGYHQGLRLSALGMLTSREFADSVRESWAVKGRESLRLEWPRMGMTVTVDQARLVAGAVSITGNGHEIEVARPESTPIGAGLRSPEMTGGDL